MSELIRSLFKTAPLVHSGGNFRAMARRWRYCFRGLSLAPFTRQWFAFLQRPEFRHVAARHPHLFHKIQRPYLNLALTPAQRLEALKEHYGFMVASFSSEMLQQLYGSAGIPLAEIPMEGHENLMLRLSFSRFGQKEGDLHIDLIRATSGDEIYSLVFSVVKYRENEREIFIGGLQGRNCIDKESIVLITRRLFGLRPKGLLVFALQHLASCWKITRLRAVSDEMQVYTKTLRSRQLYASYNLFWSECGGKLCADGMFDLPSQFVPREWPTISAKKRRMYQRRYEMLDGIAHQMQMLFATIAVL